MGSERFDSKAADWDKDPAKVSRAQEVAAAVRSAVPIDPGARLMEYGAGTGLVTQFLGEAVGSAVLADNSAGMRAVIEQKIEAGVLRNAETSDLDLEQDEVPQKTFDLIVSSMVMHHVRDLPRVLTGFAALLHPGGHLCLADLDREDGSFHDVDFDGHHGFDRAELTQALEGAGFSAVTVSDCTSIEKAGRTFTVFLATATR